MTERIPFTKMHGAGNDYIYVDTRTHDLPDPAGAAVAWSDRHKGIGSDGLVLIGRSPIPEADFSMRIFNADGSEAMMCGNASRCIGKYLYDRGITTQTHIRLLTLSGIKTLILHLTGEAGTPGSTVSSVTVDMLEPQLKNHEQFVGGHDRLHDVTVGAVDTEFAGTFVSMGNPHFVIFVDDVGRTDVARYGAFLENHPFFPQRCNIEFAEVRDGGAAIRTRVWERGSGITQACGTGACATAVAAAVTGRAPRRSHILMDGGTLDIEWCEADRATGGGLYCKNHVYMTGPAAFVFDGEVELPG